MVVADGFTGNVALKVLEATVKTLTRAIGARRALRPASSRSAAC